jgi:hypothetical protein
VARDRGDCAKNFDSRGGLSQKGTARLEEHHQGARYYHPFGRQSLTFVIL